MILEVVVKEVCYYLGKFHWLFCMRPMSTIWDEFDAGSWKKVLDRRKFFKSRVEGKNWLCIVVVVLFIETSSRKI